MEDAKISTESLVTERLRVTLAETEAERDELRAKYRELQCQQDESHYQRALRLEKQLADAERRAEEAQNEKAIAEINSRWGEGWQEAISLEQQRAEKAVRERDQMKGEANRSAKHADTLKARIAELEAQNAELRQSERTLAQQRDRAHENLARVTAMWRG
jgi:hypothetical protein